MPSLAFYHHSLSLILHTIQTQCDDTEMGFRESNFVRLQVIANPLPLVWVAGCD